MSWYIGTLEDCDNYNQLITSQSSYTGRFTTDWDTPIKHPTLELYAIVAHSTDPGAGSGLVFAQELSEDWNPIEEE